MAGPLVSILIPSYNHGRYIHACLDSIRQQTLSDWEVVIVDDGSTDDSVAAAELWAAEDTRFRVFQNEQNLGTYGTEQRALELSTGSLVAIMNSDDLWDSSKLERQVSALAQHPTASFCYCLGWQVDDLGQIDRSEDVHADWPTEELQEPLPYLLYENRILASGVLFRREGLRFETSCRYSGDWVALLERSLAGPAACVSDRLTFWRQHETNTYRRSPKQVLEEIRVRRAIAANPSRWFLPRMDPALVSLGLAKNAINLQVLSVLCGDRRLAWSAARQAFKYHPNKRWLWKRVAAMLLPHSMVKRRFWKGEDLGLTAKDVEAVAPLVFR